MDDGPNQAGLNSLTLSWAHLWAPTEADAVSDDRKTARECKQPLIEVDNRGKHLHGCVSCNGGTTLTATWFGY
jgi:hypothetical protein